MAHTLKHTFMQKRTNLEAQHCMHKCVRTTYACINTRKTPDVNVRDCDGGKRWDEGHIKANPPRD